MSCQSNSFAMQMSSFQWFWPQNKLTNNPYIKVNTELTLKSDVLNTKEFFIEPEETRVERRLCIAAVL